MKRARFFIQGRYHEGILAGPGSLLDESGQLHREEVVTFLPPVVPHSVIGLPLTSLNMQPNIGLDGKMMPLLPALLKRRRGRFSVALWRLDPALPPIGFHGGRSDRDAAIPGRHQHIS